MDKMIADDEVESCIKDVEEALEGLHAVNANIVLIELLARRNAMAGIAAKMSELTAVSALLEAVVAAHGTNWERLTREKVN